MDDNVTTFIQAPLENVALIGVLTIILIVLVPIMVVYLKKKLGITKIGPVNFEATQMMEHLDLVTANQHYMDDEIHDEDDRFHQKCHELVESIELHLAGILRPTLKHGLLLESIVNRVSLIFTSSIIRNHFTKEFMPDKYSLYRSKLISKIRDRYSDLYERIHDSEILIVSWDEMEQKFVQIVDDWLQDISAMLKETCRDKIEIYTRYKSRFTTDAYRAKICDDCIAKNEKYIEAIDKIRGEKRSMY
jgi:hypothetical protein